MEKNPLALRDIETYPYINLTKIFICVNKFDIPFAQQNSRIIEFIGFYDFVGLYEREEQRIGVRKIIYSPAY